jgi:peptidoglycan-associated lipoprotein
MEKKSMKTFYSKMLLALTAASLLFTGCQKSNNSMWDDNRSASSFKQKSGKSLWGNDDTLLVNSDDLIGPSNEDFIPLKEEDLKAQLADGAIPQPRSSPGDPNSNIPGIDRFHEPTSQLAAIFRTVFFNTDDHILRGREYLRTMDEISSFLKSNPNTYIFVEGHCDARGPEAYNLALGARRANFVRTILVKNGVHADQVHSISYGKERPAVLGNTNEAWAKNRRAQFKIFQKSRENE